MTHHKKLILPTPQSNQNFINLLRVNKEFIHQGTLWVNITTIAKTNQPTDQALKNEIYFEIILKLTLNRCILFIFL